MKKILLLFVLFLSLIGLVACNETVPNDGSVKLDITDAYKQYIKYDDIPSFTLNFDGNLNTIANVNKSYYTVFSSNDDIILSDALSELFENNDCSFEVVNEDQVSERKFSVIENGKLKNINMPCDDGYVYDEIAYVNLSNGLKLTVDYCRFTSGGKTYYTWRYSRSIAMFLYYPVMRIQNNNEDELVLLTLPQRINIHVSPELKLASILTKEEYLEDTYYTFEYFHKETLEEEKQYVIDYYKNYNYVKVDNDTFTFEYLNNKFSVKLNDKNFVISWLERI